MGKRWRKYLRSVGQKQGQHKRPPIRDPYQRRKVTGSDWQPTKVNLDTKRAHNRQRRKMRRASRQAQRA